MNAVPTKIRNKTETFILTIIVHHSLEFLPMNRIRKKISVKILRSNTNVSLADYKLRYTKLEALIKLLIND